MTKQIEKKHFENEKCVKDISPQRDRGDHPVRRVQMTKIETLNDAHAEQNRIGDRGDTGKTAQFRIPLVQKRMENCKCAHIPCGRLTDKKLKKIEEKMNKEIKPLDIITRRRLYHMYTFRKASGDNSNNVNKDETKIKIDLRGFEIKEQKDHKFCEESTQKCKQASEKASQNVQTPFARSPSSATKRKVLTNSPRTRKPLIKTITDKQGIFNACKAVTFVDNLKKLPLKIKIDNKVNESKHSSDRVSPRSHSQRTDSRRSNVSEISSQKNVQRRPSPSSIQKLIMNRKQKNKGRRRNTSPVVKVESPKTKVAKWVPQSVTEHTKPYYEAWVNTTLTATSKDDESARNEKEKILEQMRERLEYQASWSRWSEENLSDEKFTGIIKVVRH